VTFEFSASATNVADFAAARADALVRSFAALPRAGAACSARISVERALLLVGADPAAELAEHIDLTAVGSVAVAVLEPFIAGIDDALAEHTPDV
jgi:hypothetical protein